MLRKSVIAAMAALLCSATAQAGGPLLPRVQAGLKQVPALAAPVTVVTRGAAAALSRPALAKPLAATALPGLPDAQAKYYHHPRDPGSGADWLDYNINHWNTRDVQPYSKNAAAVVFEFSYEAIALGWNATTLLNSCSDCGSSGNVLVNVQAYAGTVLDFGLSRGAGLTTKVGPAPIPKRPEALSGLDPTIRWINSTAFGPYGQS